MNKNKIRQYSYYRITKTIGYRGTTPVRKAFYGKTKKEAMKKYMEYTNKLDHDKSLSDIMEYWLYNIKKYSNIKQSSFDSYESLFRNHIKTSEVAFISLNDITPIKLQDYYIKCLKKENKTSKIIKVHKLLSTFFNWCIKCGYMQVNPCSVVSVPKAEKKDTIEYYTEKEVLDIVKKIKGYEIELMVLLAIYTGLRERRDTFLKILGYRL